MSQKYSDHSNTYNPLINQRKTVALLSGPFSSSYQEKIMFGVTDAAKEMDINVICFAGGVINSVTEYAQSREKAFDLFDRDLVDGIIIPMNSHARYLTQDEIYKYLERFSPLPVVNIGSKLRGYTNIIPDFERGLTQLIDHLVDVHGCSRIALFRGPITHMSSTDRMNIYKSCLKKKGIQVDEKLIIYGDQNRKKVHESIETLFDNNPDSCEAIICLNDNQALGVIECLEERGIKVPEDMIVTGIMGIIEGNFSHPPLTTIEEPMYELGRAALLALDKKMKGEQQLEDIFIPTELIIRQSCGCKGFIAKKQPLYIKSSQSFQSLADASYENRLLEIEKECWEILNKHRCLYYMKDIVRILPKYYKALVEGDEEEFFIDLRQICNQVVASSDVLAWIAIVAILDHSAIQYLKATRKIDEFADFIEKLIVIKEEAQINAITYQTLETDINNFYMRKIISNTNAAFNLQSIIEYATIMLNVSDLYISLYEDVNVVKGWAKNEIAVRRNMLMDVDEKEKRFQSTKLMPKTIENYKDRYTFLVFPLCFKMNSFGYMVVGLGKKDGKLYENISAIIRNAWQNELQFQELKVARERFRDIAHSTSDWLWETNKENCFTYCSNNVLNVIGYNQEEMIGKNLFELTTSKNAVYDEMIAERKSLDSIEVWNRHKNGSLVCLLVSAKPIIKAGMFVGFRGVFEDVTEQRNQEERIRKLAYHDTLTGLPNRTLFQEKLEINIKEAEKHNKQFALMFLDLDRFKYINDSMGHSAGDMLLKQVALILKGRLREKDILARLGGDEFTILISDIKDKQEVIDVAKMILDSLVNPLILNENHILVTISIGIATYPMNGIDSKSLLKNADTAMYKAKDSGRNRYIFYDSVMDKVNKDRIIIEEILYRAVNENAFIVEYQPQVNCVTGRLVRVEALVRMKSSEFGVIPPGKFIPLAEELGLIGHIDQFVFEEACRQYNEWIHKGYEAIKIAVNLSAIQLRDQELVDKYTTIIKKYNVNPCDIQLEITESVLIDNENIALEIIESFIKYGIKIVLDDFGTGQSSLRCIKMFPIDTVKIDRMFVKDSMYNDKNVAIINGVMQMANSLNIGIVAEGVETQSEYEMIRSLGCNEIQGYYFSKPRPAKVIESFMEEKFRFDI
jgi:diguanylate cyclase (GGDEF)-like protein/PAS domain S-box-containing protein